MFGEFVTGYRAQAELDSLATAYRDALIAAEHAKLRSIEARSYAKAMGMDQQDPLIKRWHDDAADASQRRRAAKEAWRQACRRYRKEAERVGRVYEKLT